MNYVFTVVVILLPLVSITLAKDSYSKLCSGALTNPTGSFRTPKQSNQSDNYPNSLKCKWTINIPKDGDVTMYFRNFRTESCCDHVKLTTEKGSLINQYSGPYDNLNVTITSQKASRVDVTFKSDSTVSYRGFVADYVIRGLKPDPTKGSGAGTTLMESFFKMATALTRIINAVLSSREIQNPKSIVKFKSDLYQSLKGIETLKSVASPALTKDENDQLNLALKHLNQKAKSAIAKLESILAPDLCSLPVEVGPCRASFPRFFYDKKTSKCTSFTYGGCQGNGNNFLKIEDCQSICMQVPKPWCPPGQSVYNCTTNPCNVDQCPAYTTHLCKPNYCDGCNALHFDQHDIKIPPRSCYCPPNQPLVTCIGDPCQTATCPSHPTAKCRARRCGSCSAEFVKTDGTIVQKC